jgi:hypothetical protein
MILSLYLFNNFHSQLFNQFELTISFRFNSSSGNSSIHAWFINLLSTSEFHRIAMDYIVNQCGFINPEIYLFKE